MIAADRAAVDRQIAAVVNPPTIVGRRIAGDGAAQQGEQPAIIDAAARVIGAASIRVAAGDDEAIEHGRVGCAGTYNHMVGIVAVI